MLRSRDLWSRLTTGLSLLDDADPRLALSARGDLYTWLHRQAATSYWTPSPAQAAELSALLVRAAPRLDPRTLRDLRFHLGLS